VAQAGWWDTSSSVTTWQLTKVRNRIRAGICPFCTRHFTDLERHVASKHPEGKA